MAEKHGGLPIHCNHLKMYDQNTGRMANGVDQGHIALGGLVG